MPDRVTHDHETVDTLDGEVARRGGTRRRCVRFDADLPADEVVRVVLDGSEYRARFRESDRGAELRGAYDTPSLARSPGEGENRLLEWLRERDLSPGRTVHLDAIDDGYRYGLRGPGEEAVYEAPGTPDESLADIARDLDG
ncbi:MAG: hypothetical protein ABEJ04_00810 [Halobacteriaceae archaeon]